MIEIDIFVSIHDKNLRALPIEMYKVYYGIAPTIMDEIFRLKNQGQYSLEN